MRRQLLLSFRIGSSSSFAFPVLLIAMGPDPFAVKPAIPPVKSMSFVLCRMNVPDTIVPNPQAWVATWVIVCFSLNIIMDAVMVSKVNIT